MAKACARSYVLHAQACQARCVQGFIRFQQNRLLQLCYTCLETGAGAVEAGAALDFGLIRGCRAGEAC